VTIHKVSIQSNLGMCLWEDKYVGWRQDGCV
jgi:hypothetical protein